jgi:hypothetical protein
MLELQADPRAGDSGKGFDAAYARSVSTLPTTLFSRGVHILMAFLARANRDSPRMSFLETGCKFEEPLGQVMVSVLVSILLFGSDRLGFLRKGTTSFKLSSNVDLVIFGAMVPSRMAAEG